MQIRHWLAAFACSLLLGSSASGQVVRGVMTVTGAEMHWWAGMAREATARLYDVDVDSVVMSQLTKSGNYDTGTITFRAKKARLIDLDKLHESVWATRLSGGTKSGLVSLEVSATGEVVVAETETVLKVRDSTAHFVLAKNPDDQHKTAFDDLRSALDRGERVVEVTGQLDGWSGRWPEVLRQLPPKPRRILLTGFETAKEK